MSTAGPVNLNNEAQATTEGQTTPRKDSYNSLAQFHIARIAGKATQIDYDLVPVKTTTTPGKKI